MTEAALNEVQRQIEAIRKQAFNEGYAAAMQAVGELASGSVPWSNASVSSPSGSGSGDSEAQQPEPRRAAVPLRTSSAVRRAPASRARRSGQAAGGHRTAAPGNRQSPRRRAERGTNARMVQEILKAVSPRAVPQAEIRKALQDKGVSLAYPSIGHALAQLQRRKAARQVGKSGTWRHS